MVRENMAMKDFYKMFFRTGANGTDKRELFDLLLKQLGIDGYTKEEVEKIKESTMGDGGYCKTQYLLQVSHLNIKYFMLLLNIAINGRKIE